MKKNDELFLESLAKSPMKIVLGFLSHATDNVLNICEEYMFDHKNIKAKPMPHKQCAENAASFLYRLLNKERDMYLVPFGIMSWIVSDGYFSGEELVKLLFENEVFTDYLRKLSIQLPEPRTCQLNIEDHIHKTKLMWDYVRNSSANCERKIRNQQSCVEEKTQPNKRPKQEMRVKMEKPVESPQHHHSVKEEKRPRSTSSCHEGSEEVSTSAFKLEKRPREETGNPGRSEKRFKVAFKAQEQSGNREQSNSKRRPYHA